VTPSEILNFAEIFTVRKL